MTTQANIPGSYGHQGTPLYNEAGRLLAWLMPADALDMPWQSNPLQSSGRTVPELCQSSALFTDLQSGRSGQDALLPFVHYYNELKILVDQLFPSRKKRKCMASDEPKGVSADRVATDPNFERTRENAAEFAAAGKAAYLLRSIFRDVTVYAKDKITQARLLTVCKRVLSTDGVSARGERSVANGDHLQFKNFNFNGRAGIRDTLYVRCPVTIDRVTGKATVAIPSFVPKTMVQAAKGSTHYKIVAGASAINFNTGDSSFMRVDTGHLPWDQLPTAATSLVLDFPPNSPDTVFVALCVEFTQQMNGQFYPLKTGRSNAATIVEVSQP
ncbi:hypothetical protein [Paraflavitalea pollutisoli]|uniref:hypothetical protein n=1 Tax=Paraflavitalea pollutisoli TaxID=3034143 RepID=UPI0023EC0E85|nr:hypothetical protein [Paraflavitalea sp. H1-2-19X]